MDIEKFLIFFVEKSYFIACNYFYYLIKMVNVCKYARTPETRLEFHDSMTCDCKPGIPFLFFVPFAFSSLLVNASDEFIVIFNDWNPLLEVCAVA